jgi:hypothetical protein
MVTRHPPEHPAFGAPSVITPKTAPAEPEMVVFPGSETRGAERGAQSARRGAQSARRGAQSAGRGARGAGRGARSAERGARMIGHISLSVRDGMHPHAVAGSLLLALGRPAWTPKAARTRTPFRTRARSPSAPSRRSDAFFAARARAGSRSGSRSARDARDERSGRSAERSAGGAEHAARGTRHAARGTRHAQSQSMLHVDSKNRKH